MLLLLRSRVRVACATCDGQGHTWKSDIHPGGHRTLAVAATVCVCVCVQGENGIVLVRT